LKSTKNDCRAIPGNLLWSGGAVKRTFSPFYLRERAGPVEINGRKATVDDC
jgi:hypothetical protein